MGFNKKYLPELDQLQKIRKETGDDLKFLTTYLYLPDAIFGPQSSLDFLKKVEKNLLIKQLNEAKKKSNRG